MPNEAATPAPAPAPELSLAQQARDFVAAIPGDAPEGGEEDGQESVPDLDAAPVDAPEEAPEDDEAPSPPAAPEELEAAPSPEFIELQERVAAHEETLGKWQNVGKRAVVQNKVLVEELTLLKSYIEEAGIQIDPRDLRMLEMRQKLIQHEVEGEVKASGAKVQSTANIEKRANELATEARSVAAKHGVDVRELAQVWNSLQATRPKITFEEAASILAKPKAPTQLERNATAPRTLSKGRPSPGVQFGATSKEAVKAFLHSRNHQGFT